MTDATLKPGLKSTEFWLALGVIAVNLLGSVAALYADNPIVASVLGSVAAVTAVVYAKLRQMLKAELAGQIDIIPDELEVVLTKYNEAIVGQLAQTLSKAPPAATPAFPSPAPTDGAGQ